MNTQTTRYGRKETTPATPPAAPAAGTPPVTPPAATPPAGDNELTIKQVEDIVLKAVQTANATARQPMDEASLRKVIGEELSKQAGDSKKLSIEQVTAAANAASNAVAEANRKQAKPLGNAADADRGNIEIPFSWRKGNLPLHAKQLLNVMMKKDVNDGIDKADIDKGILLGEKTIDRYRSMARSGQKAMTSTGSNTGDEFVPTDLSSELQRRLYLASDIAAIMAASEIEMPTQPYEYPLITTRPTFLLETTEGTDTADSTPGTANIILDAKKLMGKVIYSYELDEDSIVPILQNVQSLLAEAAAATWESVIINGDTTTVHMDTDTQTSAKAPERAFKGWRKLALAASLKKDLSSGGLNEANLRAMRKAMGKYGIKISDLMWIVGPNGSSDLQAITNVATLEKFGPRATILTGELATLFGIPIITSEANREDVDNTGVNGSSGNTYGTILLVNKSMFLTGRRRTFTVETFRDVKTQQMNVIASFRKAFVPKEVPSATIQSVYLGYKYSAA